MNFRVIFMIVLLIQAFATRSENVYMTSLEWPPYSGEALPENGISVAVAREAFAAMGYTLIVEFKPWSRAVALAKREDKYIGYFPEYSFPTSEFLFSQPIGTGPLGLVENRRNPVLWQELKDLQFLRLGVVQDYVNTLELDEMIRNGEVEVEASANDLLNIYKVAKGRLDAAVIDANVLAYLVSVDPRSETLSQRVRMNRKLLTEKTLYLALKPSPDGKFWVDVFNQGLKKIKIQVVVDRVTSQIHRPLLATPPSETQPSD